jgi:hypothetical protein
MGKGDVEEKRGKKRRVGFLKWVGTNFTRRERQFLAYLGNLKERKHE